MDNDNFNEKKGAYLAKRKVYLVRTKRCIAVVQFKTKMEAQF